MPTIRIPREDGDPIEADASQIELPEGYQLVGPDQVPEGLLTQETLNATVQERLARQKRSLKDDEDLHQEILRKYGVPLNEEGQPEIPKPQDIDLGKERERLKEAILRDEVEPLKEQLDRAEKQRQQLLESRKRAELLQAAQQAKVKPEYLRAVVDGASPPIFSILGDAIAYSPEHDQFAVREGEGFAAATKRGQAYAGIEDLFDRLKKDDGYSHLFEDRRPGSTGMGETNGEAPQGAKKRSEMSRKEKVAYVQEHGREAFDKLPQ